VKPIEIAAELAQVHFGRGTPRHVMHLDAAIHRALGLPLTTREAGKRWGFSNVTAGKILRESETVQITLGHGVPE